MEVVRFRSALTREQSGHREPTGRTLIVAEAR